MKRKYITLAFLIGISLLLIPLHTLAQKKSENFTLPKGEVITDDVFAIGDSVKIDGVLDGDLYAAAGIVEVTGEVTGDVIVAGETVIVSGSIGDDVIAVGQTIDLYNSQITGSARVFGLTVKTNDSTKIDETLVFGAHSIGVSGHVGRNMVGGAAEIILDGDIGRDVLVATSDLRILSESSIAGNLTYTASGDTLIDSKAIIKGSIKEIDESTGQVKKEDRAKLAGVGVGFNMWSYFSTLLVGLVLLRFFEDFTKKAASFVGQKPLAALGWGLVTLLLTPFMLIFLGVTIIGIPLMIFILMLFIIELYSAKIIIAVWLGEKLNVKLNLKSANKYLNFAVGLLVIYIAGLIPPVAIFVSLLTLLSGLGAIVLAKRDFLAGKK